MYNLLLNSGFLEILQEMSSLMEQSHQTREYRWPGLRPSLGARAGAGNLGLNSPPVGLYRPLTRTPAKGLQPALEWAEFPSAWFLKLQQGASLSSVRSVHFHLPRFWGLDISSSSFALFPGLLRKWPHSPTLKETLVLIL